MNEIDFYELLKKEKGKTFYNKTYKYVRLQYVCRDFLLFATPIPHLSLYLEINGKYPGAGRTDEIAIYPSRSERDWNKWKEERELMNSTKKQS